MPIVFNLFGLLFALLALGCGAVVHAQFAAQPFSLRSAPSAPFLLAFGLVALAADGAYRGYRKRTSGLGRFFDPTVGGQVMILPVWLWGAAALGVGGYLGVGKAMQERYYARVLARDLDLRVRFEEGDRLAYSADGRRLACLGLGKHSADAKRVASLEKQLAGLAKQVASQGKEGPPVEEEDPAEALKPTVWDVATLRTTDDTPRVRFDPDPSALSASQGQRRVTWSPGSIAVASASAAPRTIDLGKCYDCVRGVAIAPDGSMVAAIISSRSVRPNDIVVWDTETLARRGTFRHHERHPLAVAFSPDDKTLTEITWDGRLLDWRIDGLR
jgi:hypothetical protein